MMRHLKKPTMLLLVLPALLATSVWAAKKPKTKTVIYQRIDGTEDRQPEAPLTPAVGLPVTASLESATQCPKAAVAFRNGGRSVLTLRIAGGQARDLGPGARVVECADDAIVPWQVTAASGWRYGGRMDVSGLQLREELLIEPGATLDLVNATGEPQRMRLDGRDLGWLDPGKSRTLGPLTTGKHELLGQGKVSRRKDAKVVHVHAGGMSTLTWEPPPTWTQIRNPENEAAHVVVDGVGFGDVAPHAELRVLGLGGGKHQALLTYVPSGKQKKLDVVASPAGDPPGPSPELELTLQNQTGEILDLPEGLRDWGREIDVGATLHARVPRRTFGINLTGQASGVRYHLDIHGRTSPEHVTWLVTRPRATLRVQNATLLPLHVELPDGASLDVARNTERTADVPAGRMKLKAVARGGDAPRTWARGMTIKPGKAALWRVSAPGTALMVTSGYSEPLWVRLDGVATIKLLPGKSMRLNARPGTHTLDARAPRSGTAAKMQLRLDDGERRTVTIKPPTGTLRLTAGTRPVQVFVRGVAVAEAQPGEPMAVPVTAGEVQAEVRDDKGRSSNFVGLVAPTQQVELTLPAADVAALEIGWQGTEAAQISVDAGAEMTLQPGTSLRLDGVQRGPHLVAVASGGFQWRRWVQVDGRQAVARVVLKPAAK